jgi:hypothetical protein
LQRETAWNWGRLTKAFESVEFKRSRGSNSAVECDLAKVEVAGSNPVSRFGSDECGMMNDEFRLIHHSAFIIQHDSSAA